MFVCLDGSAEITLLDNDRRILPLEVKQSGPIGLYVSDRSLLTSIISISKESIMFLTAILHY